MEYYTFRCSPPPRDNKFQLRPWEDTELKISVACDEQNDTHKGLNRQTHEGALIGKEWGTKRRTEGKGEEGEEGEGGKQYWWDPAQSANLTLGQCLSHQPTTIQFQFLL